MSCLKQTEDLSPAEQQSAIAHVSSMAVSTPAVAVLECTLHSALRAPLEAAPAGAACRSHVPLLLLPTLGAVDALHVMRRDWLTSGTQPPAGRLAGCGAVAGCCGVELVVADAGAALPLLGQARCSRRRQNMVKITS